MRFRCAVGCNNRLHCDSFSSCLDKNVGTGGRLGGSSATINRPRFKVVLSCFRSLPLKLLRPQIVLDARSQPVEN